MKKTLTRRTRLALAAGTVSVLFVSSCSAFLYNYDKREPDEPVPKPVPTVTVTATPAPAPTVRVTVTPSNTEACKQAGILAVQVRELTSQYTRAMGTVPEALSEAQKGLAMKDLARINEAEEKLNKADNESTESLQQLILLDKRLAELNEQCSG